MNTQVDTEIFIKEEQDISTQSRVNLDTTHHQEYNSRLQNIANVIYILVEQCLTMLSMVKLYVPVFNHM